MKNYLLKEYLARLLCLRWRKYILGVLLENPTRCYEEFHMKPHIFTNLYDRLKMRNLLQDFRDVSVEEGVVMGLAILCHGTT